ncbi:hypothetical protein AMECASPLE_012782 [Ameca splendens]|uniref:Secreted protein n=1 Tax=Ameca splendens TaxID=208324 RepID=A0ABV0YCB4_9TELE
MQNHSRTLVLHCCLPGSCVSFMMPVPEPAPHCLKAPEPAPHYFRACPTLLLSGRAFTTSQCPFLASKRCCPIMLQYPSSNKGAQVEPASCS